MPRDAFSYNRVFLCGFLGKDPELRYFRENDPFCHMSVATQESTWTKEGGHGKYVPTWHNVVCWGRMAEYCDKFLKKGGLVIIEGKMRNRTWEDKNGVKHYKTEILASNVVNMTKRKKKNEDITEEDEIGVGVEESSPGEYEDGESSVPF